MIYCPAQRLWLPGKLRRDFFKRVEPSRAGLISGGLVGSSHGLVNSDIIRPHVAVPPPPLSPLSWWDAEYQAFQDAGTTPATANNDPVLQLNDGTGTNNLSNSGGTARPLLKTNVVNSHSAIQFDGSNDYLDKAFTWSADSTLFACIRIDTWSNTKYLFGPHSGDNYDVYMDGSSPNINTYMGGTTGVANGDMVVGTFAIVCVRAGTTIRKLRVNNGSTTTVGNGNAASTGLQWAAHAGSLFGAVTIARVAIYTSELSDADETTVRNAFNTRYACF